MKANHRALMSYSTSSRFKLLLLRHILLMLRELPPLRFLTLLFIVLAWKIVENSVSNNVKFCQWNTIAQAKWVISEAERRSTCVNMPHHDRETWYSSNTSALLTLFLPVNSSKQQWQPSISLGAWKGRNKVDAASIGKWKGGESVFMCGYKRERVAEVKWRQKSSCSEWRW